MEGQDADDKPAPGAAQTPASEGAAPAKQPTGSGASGKPDEQADGEPAGDGGGVQASSKKAGEGQRELSGCPGFYDQAGFRFRVQARPHPHSQHASLQKKILRPLPRTPQKAAEKLGKAQMLAARQRMT